MKKKVLGLLLVLLFGVLLVACNKVDLVAPVISGVADHEIVLGDAKPDYLLNVSAFDEVDKDVLVTVDDSNVDLSKPGKYTIIFSAVDKAGNRSFEVKTVTVTGIEGIKFTGAKDHRVIIGDVWPDFEAGVIATDGNGNQYEIVVDSSGVKTDEKGTYPIYIKAVDIVGKTLAIQEQSVNVVYKEETQKIADFIRGIDYTHVGTQSTHLSVKLGLGDIATPHDSEEPALGVYLHDMSLTVDLFVDLDSYETSVIYGEVSLNISKINMIRHNGDGTFIFATGTEDAPDWFNNSHIKYGFFITENRLNVFAEAILDVDGSNTPLTEILGFANMMQMIPEEAQPFIDILTPILTNHKESVFIEYNQEKHFEAAGITMMAKSFFLNLEMEKAINQELWPVNISNGTLTVDNVGLFTINNPEFANILPILELVLGTIDISPFIQTILNTTIDVTLSTENNKFSKLIFDFNGIDLEILLSTKNVLLPEIPNIEDVIDPDNPETVLIPGFQEVESLTIVKTILELIDFIKAP